MNRDRALAAIRDAEFDFVVIGGGATGLGIAVDAAARGYRVALLERHDFAKGTSSRSTKLVHGGVRYLKQGNVPLVLEALRERGLLTRNAPHLVGSLEFVIPVYHWWDGPFYGIGMKVYDALAGRLGLQPSRILSREETLAAIPNVEPQGLLRGVSYHDGQFDDARLAVNLAQTCTDHGGFAVNYVEVTGLIREHGRIRGVEARDAESGETFPVRARVTINATGVFCDSIRRMEQPEAREIVTFSQGVHLVLPRRFLPGSSAIMVPHTEDGRVLFAVPWNDRVVVGTTDTPVPVASAEPRALEEEIAFLMTHAARYLDADPQPRDVLSLFAGLRPLLRGSGGKATAALSRDHAVVISEGGLLTVTGGKWTTYRQMAEEAVDAAETLGGYEPRPCPTRSLAIHGATDERPPDPALSAYGSDAPAIVARIRARPELGHPVHHRLPLTGAAVLHAVEHEMARTVEDLLSRRTRALLLDARSSIEAAPAVAALMATALGRDPSWESDQARTYHALAQGYLL